MNEPAAPHQRQKLVSPPQKLHNLNESGAMYHSSTVKAQYIISNSKNSLADLGISVGGGYGELGENVEVREPMREGERRNTRPSGVSSVPGNDYGGMQRSR